MNDENNYMEISIALFLCFYFNSSVWQQSQPFTGKATREIWKVKKIKLVDHPDSETAWELIEFKVTYFFF